MNYILTKACNKGCPYCFAHESRCQDPKSYVSLEKFKEMVIKFSCNNSRKDHVKLLGGEPTMHPQFKEILKFLEEKKLDYTLISNFLFGEDILNAILSSIEKTQVSFLVNATDLDIKNRIEKWAYNYSTIYNKLYPLDLEETLGVGITIDQTRDASYYINYLDFVRSRVPKIEGLRISLNFPGDQSCKNKLEYINNTKIGQIIVYLTQYCLQNFIRPHIDCIIYPCMFESKEEFKFIRKFLLTKQGNNNFICNGVPCDIGPDGSAWACYPLKGKVEINNILDFESAREAMDNLITQKKIIQNIIKDELPDACKSCSFYNLKMCEGPALCHYDLSKITIPKFL